MAYCAATSVPCREVMHGTDELHCVLLTLLNCHKMTKKNIHLYSAEQHDALKKKNYSIAWSSELH